MRGGDSGGAFMRTRSGWHSIIFETPEITLTVYPLLTVWKMHALFRESLVPWWNTLFVKQQPCEISKFLQWLCEGTRTKTMGGQTAKSTQKAFERGID